MPTYEFRCPSGHDFEKFYRSIGTADTAVPCPSCGKLAQRQLSAGAGLVFKGSGFYITDYGKDGKKGQTQPAAADEKKGDAPSETVAARPETAGASSPGEVKGADATTGAGATKPRGDKPPKAKPAKKTTANE